MVDTQQRPVDSVDVACWRVMLQAINAEKLNHKLEPFWGPCFIPPLDMEVPVSVLERIFPHAI